MRKSSGYWIIFLWLATVWTCGAGEGQPEPTRISSTSLKMQGSGDRNHFYFEEDVIVTGTNLELRCQQLTVVALRAGEIDATIGEIGAIESIVAVGGVEIHQAGRSAYAERAEVDPVAGTVVLKGNPRVVDGEVEVTGYEFILRQGERIFEVVPDPNVENPADSRSVVRLGSLPDLGFDQEAEAITVDEALGEASPGETPLPPAGEESPDE